MAAADDLLRWATSGAMALTGPADGAPRPEPAGVSSAAEAAAADVASMTARTGHRVEVDGPALLAERAAFAGLARNGSVSVGGAARFERCRDGWIVLNLPRGGDLDLLPALLEATVDPADWPAVQSRLATLDAAHLVERGAELGLAIARPDERPQLAAPGRELVRGPGRSPNGPERPALVLDFTSLWAGPLAGSLLAESGARVIKIEGRDRPDGAREGPRGFFDLLNGGKECLAVDLGDRADWALLRRMIAAADLVIEGSRPRAMTNIGVHPTAVVDEHATSWISITGHGRVDHPDRIGYGDDTAVAGGIWIDDGPTPMFVADAVADPLTGLAVAALGAELLAAQRAAVLDVPLSRVAAWARSRPVHADVGGVADSGWHVEVDGERVAVAEPRGRTVWRSAAPLDGHGDALRAEFAAR